MIWLLLLVCFALAWAGLFLSLMLDPAILSQVQPPPPQAIILLDSSPALAHFTLEFTYTYPQLPLWVVAQTPEQQLYFLNAPIAPEQLNFARYPHDTVLTLITLGTTLRLRRLRHVFLITNPRHMLRARALSMVIWGSQGVWVYPIAIEASDPRGQAESLPRLVHDLLRAVVWLVIQNFDQP